MGLINCSKHGDSGFAQRISASICEKIRNDLPVKNGDLKIISIDLYDGDEYLSTNRYLITENEFLDSGLNLCNDVMNEESYDLIKAKLPPMDGVCFNCLEDYKKKHSLDLLFFN